MRTTLNLDDHLAQEAKVLAARTGRTLTEVIEESLRMSLRLARPPEAPRPRLPVASGHRWRGVPLDDNGALLAVMDDSA